MTAKLAFLVLFALAIASHAVGQQPVPVYTFICNGNAFLFQGTCPQGGRPDSIIQASDGNFYGAAQDSMEGSSAPTGGTVYSLTPTGTFKLLHTFVPGANKLYAGGNLPGFVTEGPDGKIYGTTLFGGNKGCNGYCGYGVLYRVNKDGSAFQIIHKFCSQANCADGANGGALVVGNDGNLYGLSSYGGDANCGITGGCGTIFRVTPSTGAFKVVLNFEVATSGEAPSSLFVAADGTFYGNSFGTVSQLIFHYTEATGTLTTALVKFPTFNGLPSRGGVSAFGPNGNLYGLYVIYATSGIGMFEVQTDGSNLQLFPFYNTIQGGGSPDTYSLFLASDGNFWLPDFNGSTGYGDIISLSPNDGALLQSLTPFSASSSVGAYPDMLIQAKDGTLWGATDQFGKYTKGHFADGTVFSLNAGLPPR